MLDRYDTTVATGAWTLAPDAAAVRGAAAHVVTFAGDHGMHEPLLASLGSVVAYAFAGVVGRLDPDDRELVSVDAATDGECLAVRIAAPGAGRRGGDPATPGHERRVAGRHRQRGAQPRRRRHRR